MDAKPTRGERNCNPGNLEKGPAWAGLAPDQADARFAVFVSADYGIRAIGKQLQAYQDKHGLRTIRGAISRYSPSADPGNGCAVTAAYVKSVARQTGLDPDAVYDAHDPVTLAALVAAMITVEQGRNVYANTKEFERGIQLATA